MALSAGLAVGLSVGLDLLVGEVPNAVHPVALFGRIVAALDREYQRPRAAGVALAVALPLGAAAVVGCIVAAFGSVSPLVGPVAAGLVLFTTTSLRRLLTAALTVVEASATDVARARAAAPALVGRDPSALSPAHLRSAAVESAAENLADGLIAPLGAFVLATPAAGAVDPRMGLPAGAAAAAWVKAVNTLDSMLGYHDEPAGWASARLDDLTMWLPARASAVLLGVAAGSPLAVGRARRDARCPASPNSGWPMATLAVALGIALEKPGVYHLNPDRDLPSVVDSRRAIRVVGLAGLFGLALAAAGVIAWS